MANLGFNVNVNDLPEEQNFEPIPAGEYSVAVSSAELKDTSAGTGKFISLKLTVTGPSHEGRILFSNINIQNPSQKAEEIGRQQLGSVMRAIGLANLTDTDQLIGGNMAVRVVVGEYNGMPKNEVKGYKAINGSAPPAPAASGSATAQSGAGAPPWARK